MSSSSSSVSLISSVLLRRRSFLDPVSFVGRSRKRRLGRHPIASSLASSLSLGRMYPPPHHHRFWGAESMTVVNDILPRQHRAFSASTSSTTTTTNTSTTPSSSSSAAVDAARSALEPARAQFEMAQAQLRVWDHRIAELSSSSLPQHSDTTTNDASLMEERLLQGATEFGSVHQQRATLRKFLRRLASKEEKDDKEEKVAALREQYETLIQQYATLQDDMLKHVNDLYRTWKRQRRPTRSLLAASLSSTSTVNPCAALLHVQAVLCRNGPAALELLQDWEAWYGGDLEQAPLAMHYQQVLQAYAMAAPPSLPKNQDTPVPLNDTNDHEPRETATTPHPEAVAVALEIMEHLEQSYPTLSKDPSEVYPNLYTYQYVIRCISRAFRYEHALRTTTTTEEATEVDTSQKQQQLMQQYWTQLQSVLDRYLQQVPGSDATFSTEQFTSLVLTVSDVIPCYHAILTTTTSDLQPLLNTDPEMMHLRRQELARGWWRLVQPGNADLWLNLAPDDDVTGFSLLEQTTKALFDLRHRDVCDAATLDAGLGHVEAMTQCLWQLDDMMMRAGSFLPSARHFHRVIHSWRYLMQQDRQFQYYIIGQQQLTRIVQRMEEQHARNHALPQSPVEHEYATNSWNALLQSYLDARLPDKVMELWKKNKEVKMGRIRRNQESFTILLLAYAAKRRNDTYPQARERAKQAHSVLSKLVTYDPAIRKFEPTSQHFTSVMVAWSRSYHYDAALYCQQVFDYMMEESQRRRAQNADDTSLTPTATQYRSLIVTWGYSRHPDAMSRVLHLYEQMKRSDMPVDRKTHATVLFALSRTRMVAGAQLAEQLLDQLEADTENAIRGTESVTPGPEHEDAIEEEEILHLTVDCYKSVMYAWAHCGLPDSYEPCSKVFQRLMTAYEKSGWKKDYRPDSATYAILIDSIVSENKVPSKDIATQAENILKEMESQVAAGRCEPPNALLYTSVMKAYWKSQQPDSALKVEDLIRRMKQSYEAGNAAAKPDAHAMTILIQTWARSDAPNKATIVWEICKEMQAAFNSGDLNMRPNQYTLCAVLNACAFTNSPDASVKSEAVKIALMALNELDKGTDGGLNDFAFRYMFQVIANQIDDITDRTLHAKVIFERCCQAGFLSAFTLNILKDRVPGLFYRLPRGADRKPVIPPQWSRNTSEYEKKDPVSLA